MASALLLTLLLQADAAAAPGRAQWEYHRGVSLRESGSIASLVLPPELSARAAPRARDLRLVTDAGVEVPYLLDWTDEREGFASWRVGLQDVRREREEGPDAATRVRFTIDLGAVRTFTDVVLDVPDQSFAWHARVEVSKEGESYELAVADAALMDQIWNGARVRRTDVRFDEPRSARYVRVTARSAADSRAFEIRGASAILRRRLKGDLWSMNVPTRYQSSEGRVSRYRLEASSRLPFTEIALDCADAAFSRRVRLVEVSGPRGSIRSTLGEGVLFRVRAGDAVVSGETLAFFARSGNGGDLELEIEDGDSPPLRGLTTRMSGPRLRLIFNAPSRDLTLYYGNGATRGPLYDLEALRPRLIQAAGLLPASLAKEERNPAYIPEPPLRFPATLGATVVSTDWMFERVLEPILEEDVYSLALGVDDLHHLRGDLADLRIVDSEDRQIPFLVDRDVSEEIVPLTITKADAESGRSSFLLAAAPGPPASNSTLIANRIELDFANPFFERRGWMELPRSKRESRAAGLSLSRRPESTGPIVVTTPMPVEDWRLVVEDGDDAPLDLRAARAIVRTHRIVFKAPPSRPRLLLGNQGAAAPRYDLAGLRGELLAYSALAARAGALAPNASAGRSLKTSVRNLSPDTLVWMAIVAAVAVLVGVTASTLRKS